MADFRSTYHHAVVRTVEDFLMQIEELTNETKGRLSKLGEISEVAASLEKEKGEVDETSRARYCIELIESFLTALLFGPYMGFLTKLADSSSMVKKMENKQEEEQSFQLPKTMQLRVDSFKHYLEKAKGRLEVIDEVLEELIEKVYEAKGKHFKISDEEIAHLEMKTAKVNRALEACKKYLGEAENEINKLESDIASEMKSFNMKNAAIGSGVGAALMIGGAYFYSWSTLKEIAGKLGYMRGGLLVGAAVSAAKCFCLSYSLILEEHKKLFTPHLETLKEELGKVKTEYELKKRDFEKDVTGNMEAKH